MQAKSKGWQFINDRGDFLLKNPQHSTGLYFPLANASGFMSCITPTLGGHATSGQNSFLMTPVSAEDLHNSRNTRNFWVYVHGKGAWSAAGNSVKQLSDTFSENPEEEVVLEAGILWHKVVRKNKTMEIQSEITSFVPVGQDKVELMKVTIRNLGKSPITITSTAAVPVYGRSADNLRDHRHVTSLLHRIFCFEKGIEVQPVLTFDERGHKINSVSYMVYGAQGDGAAPIGSIPVVEEFIGEGGNLEWPEAIIKNLSSLHKAGDAEEGYEAIGALRFKDEELFPGKSASYVVLMGICDEGLDKGRLAEKYLSEKSFDAELKKNQDYWQRRLSGCEFKTGDKSFDLWMKWVTLQPILRRIYGCSFLPHHDYGRGGRGWRDLWQDCLALLIMDPDEVRSLLYNNFAGVRIDGSNATIIGTKPGEFVADRNNIPRVWMDHGAWPYLTTRLYLDLSGDIAFLLEKQTYFKDALICRSRKRDQDWTPEYGNKLRDAEGRLHEATLLEHLLLQNLVPFFNVGEHNNIRMEGADWNDAFDMAEKRGESVAFTALYGSNLKDMAALLRVMKERLGIGSVELTSEIKILLDTIHGGIDYNSVDQKHDLLDKYFMLCKGSVSGKKEKVDIELLARDLDEKADWIAGHLRKDEWITSKEGYSWFNGYYNNDAERIEGDHPDGVRMTLTGQVFTVMGGIAAPEQVKEVSRSVARYLKDGKLGYRLNTRFRGLQQNIGRAFGFAYGHKENGAMFRHMAVMYANALYQRGFVNEGHDVIWSIYSLCNDFKTARIYPGIPEYFSEKGRGLYHYLTGSASWLMLTVISQIFGVRGCLGDLVIEPKLKKEQFDPNGLASVKTLFAGKQVIVNYHNSSKKDYEEYAVKAVKVNGQDIILNSKGKKAKIERALLLRLCPHEINRIDVELH